MTAISRSEYQKVVEHNKKLLKDIEILTMPEYRTKRSLVFKKWQHYFTKIKENHEFIKQAAMEYIKRHKDEFKHLPLLNKLDLY